MNVTLKSAWQGNLLGGLSLILAACGGGPKADLGTDLARNFEEAREHVARQRDDFAVKERGASLTPAFATFSSPMLKTAGFATDGALEVARGRPATIWFGYLSGPALRELGVADGYYRIVAGAGAVGAGSTTFMLTDRDEREVARLPATVSLRQPGGPSGIICSWAWLGECLYIICCADFGQEPCVEIYTCIFRTP
ncbi:MAG TPA: hypothetical protein VGA56_19500 [Opitutaceae bacterium]